MVPDMPAVLRAPANRESFFNGGIVVAHVRTAAAIFLGTFILGLATFGVERQDDIACGTSHVGSAEVVLQAEHTHPADTHLLALREPDIAFGSLVYSHGAEHILMVPGETITEHGTVTKAR